MDVVGPAFKLGVSWVLKITTELDTLHRFEGIILRNIISLYRNLLIYEESPHLQRVLMSYFQWRVYTLANM